MVAASAGKVRWGVLGAANIAVRKVIPAMQRGERSAVVAIASRNGEKARTAAAQLGIARAYGSYEELLADPDVEAVYNPLPNHLHVPWTIRAAEAGKHVLCEKPIALSASQARELLVVRERTGVLIGEAFMVRSHPQWIAVRELVAAGRIGALKVVAGHFAYSRRDPADVRSNPEWGGGGLMDVGCYPITMSRWLFGEEPDAAIGLIDRDPELGVDRIASGLLRFPSGQATFTCGMQLVPYQRMQLHGTTGRIEVEIPFNAPPDRPMRIFVDDGREFADASAVPIEFPVVDQYTLQGDRFSAAVRGEGPVPVDVEDAIANMAVIDAVFRSEVSGRWETPV
ncbi:MAG TPA: Gfo/Idh/MocA family oxidoreductase [Gemmatimonadaceae bacterium]|nr:Gfo/Idh/MocA family oxidoreductase [Gemmatimonadaceae bacterium]